MAFTAEHREKAAEARRQKALERKAAAATAVAERPPEPEPEPTEPEGDNILGQLAGLFQQASSRAAGREKAVNEALEILGRLDPAKHPEIADNEVVQNFIERVQSARAQSPDVRPGTVLGTGLTAFKKPWMWADLNKSINTPIEEVTRRAQAGEIIFPWVEYVPIKTTPVIWNGLTVYFRARQRVKVCKVFVDTFEESLTQEEFAEQHGAWLFNVPGVQTHRDFYTTNGPRVKAMDESRGDYYKPGAGVISLASSQDAGPEAAEEA